LEYIILVTAVIVVIILFLMGNNSPFKTLMNQSYNQAGEGMVKMSNKLHKL